MKNKTWHYRFFMTVILAFAAIFGLFWMSNQLFEQKMIQQKAGEIAKEKILFTQQSQITTSLQQGKLTTKANSFLQAFQTNSQQYITLTTGKKTLFTSKNSAPLSNHAQTAISKGAHYSYEMKQLNGEKTLVVTFPLQEKNKTLGYLCLALPYAAFSQPITQFSTYSATLFIGMLVISMILFFLLYRQHTQPIKTVLPALKRIAQQPQKEALILENTTEWAELYQTVNHVGKQMNKTYLAYEANKQQLESLIHDLQIGVFLIDHHKRLRLLNPKGQSFLHIKDFKEDANYMEVINQIDLVKLIQESFQYQEDTHGEIHLTQPHEAIFDVKLRYLKQTNQVLGTLYNITEIRKIEAMQEDFVSNVSHELKTPITSIIGFIETLLDGALDEPEMARQFLQIMQKDAQRLQQLIQEIIQLTRSANELNKDDLILISPIDVSQYLLQHYQPMIQQKKLAVQVKGDAKIQILTFRYYFEPILKNLIENAITYNQEEGSLTITVTESKHHCQITISDTGIGMSETDLNRVFERFYRVDKARSRNLGGTGLGLSIVKHYTEVLHGRISVRSQLGVGTTFYLRFPKRLTL